MKAKNQKTVLAAEANYEQIIAEMKAKTRHKSTIWRRFLRNRTAVLGLAIVAILIILAFFPGQITSPDYVTQSLVMRNKPPTAAHWLGTDDVGRDLLTRIVWGTRTSLSISLSAIFFSSLAGVGVGLVAGYYGGVVDNVLMRLMDVLMAIPNILLGISVVAALGASTMNLTFAIGLGSIAPFARVARSAVITVRGQEFIEAARSNGAGNIRIMLKYVLPNSLAPIIVEVTMGIATAIITISGLSFIGLGVPAPTPEWGAMLSAARGYIRDYWWEITFPGIAIMLAVFAFNLLGDGLRDALDPRLKQ